jgi:hypothetical protein
MLMIEPPPAADHVGTDQLHELVGREQRDLEMPAIGGQWCTDETGPAWFGLGALRPRLGTRHRRATGRGERSIVDQNCDRAQRISRSLNQSTDIVAVSQVGPDRHRPSTGRLDVGDRLANGSG